MEPDAADPRDEDLAAILAACDDALARGDRRSSLDTIRAAEGKDQERLRKKLACVQLLRRLWAKTSGGESLPAELGRFQIRRELGRGGYGVVYLAFDPKLGREVALKVPRDDVLLTSALRDRFQTEARAAAVLDHPNIVPVFEAGEVGSTLYIASAYCPGPALEEWLRTQKEPVPVRWAAEVLLALADAAQHAHDRGVLHRDLKPSNVLLQIADLRLKIDSPEPSAASSQSPITNRQSPIPKVTDFGLAKLGPVFAPTAEGPAHTRSGVIVGTPTYMAPEQAAGQVKDVGPAADVYSLGAILYELLTGRPPFVADTVLDTLQLVRSAEPVSPTQLRAKLPRDLETICLKCLRKDPRQRYPSAAALGADLRRFLDGKPITARPVSVSERTWRWCRRNPTVAALGAALAAAIVVAVVGINLQVWRVNQAAKQADRERDTARTAHQTALRERDRAEANARRARTAVERMTAIGQQLYAKRETQESGRRILEQAVAFHEGFVVEQGDNADVVRDAAKAWAMVGFTREKLGQYKAAVDATRRCLDLYDQLIAGDPENLEYRREWAYRSRFLGYLYRRTDQPAEARRAYEAAAVAQRKLVGKLPDDTDHRKQLANTLMNLAGFLDDEDEPNEARRLLDEAIRLQRENLTAQPQDRSFRMESALAQETLGLLLWGRVREERGAELCRDAGEAFRQLNREDTGDESAYFLVQRNAVFHGELLADAGDLPGAERVYKIAYSGLASFRRAYPLNAAAPVLSIRACVGLGDVLRRAGKLAEAEANYRMARTLSIDLDRKIPEESGGRAAERVMIDLKLGGLLAALRRDEDAAPLLEQAAQAEVKDADTLAALARVLADCPAPRFRDPGRAVELASQAVKLRPKRAAAWSVLGLAQYRAGKPADAITSLRAATARREWFSAEDGFVLAMAYHRSGDPKRARGEFRSTADWLAKLPAGDKELERLRDEAAAVLARPAGVVILTVAANDLVRPRHNRMPTVVAPEDFAAWCDPRERDLAKLFPRSQAWTCTSGRRPRPTCRRSWTSTTSPSRPAGPRRTPSRSRWPPASSGLASSTPPGGRSGWPRRTGGWSPRPTCRPSTAAARLTTPRPR
jgi:serine/threonine protein kinase/tetratricopeptide (TPR) repeat protein